jgi:hypothetical protein
VISRFRPYLTSFSGATSSGPKRSSCHNAIRSRLHWIGPGALLESNLERGSASNAYYNLGSMVAGVHWSSARVNLNSKTPPLFAGDQPSGGIATRAVTTLRRIVD